MFVLFGIDSNIQERLDFQVLDTNSWTWIDNYVGPGRFSNGIGGPNDPGTNGGISSGVIAGIVVGVVVGVILTLGAIWFFYRRRHNKEANNSEKKFAVESQVNELPTQPPHYDDTQARLLATSTRNVPNTPANVTTATINLGHNWTPSPDAYYTPRLSLQPVKPDGD